MFGQREKEVELEFAAGAPAGADEGEGGGAGGPAGGSVPADWAQEKVQRLPWSGAAEPQSPRACGDARLLVHRPCPARRLDSPGRRSHIPPIPHSLPPPKGRYGAPHAHGSRRLPCHRLRPQRAHLIAQAARRRMRRVPVVRGAGRGREAGAGDVFPLAGRAVGAARASRVRLSQQAVHGPPLPPRPCPPQQPVPVRQAAQHLPRADRGVRGGGRRGRLARCRSCWFACLAASPQPSLRAPNPPTRAPQPPHTQPPDQRARDQALRQAAPPDARQARHRRQQPRGARLPVRRRLLLTPPHATALPPSARAAALPGVVRSLAPIHQQLTRPCPPPFPRPHLLTPPPQHACQAAAGAQERRRRAHRRLPQRVADGGHWQLGGQGGAGPRAGVGVRAVGGA
jgi:hypothetical protein